MIVHVCKRRNSKFYNSVFMRQETTTSMVKTSNCFTKQNSVAPLYFISTKTFCVTTRV